MSGTNDDERKYLDQIENILKHGCRKGDGTGTEVLSVFGLQIRYSLRGQFPLLTTQKLLWEGILEKLLRFITGSTNANELGANMRDGPQHFLDMDAGQGLDQLQKVIDIIKKNPEDPKDLQSMALPPYQAPCQFNVSNGELSCLLFQPSADMGRDVPSIITSYALLTYMIAHVTGLKPGDFVHTLGDAHIYANHIEPLKIQLQREIRLFPTLKISRRVKNIDDFRAEDFEICGYNPHPPIDMQMPV